MPRNVVPFRAPVTFERFGIDWTRAAVSEPERLLRESYLTHETGCGSSGLVSLLLLAVVSRRQGAVAEDLQAAADHAEILLALKLHKHQDEMLTVARAYLTDSGAMWL
jgi:hypothetical protein